MSKIYGLQIGQHEFYIDPDGENVEIPYTTNTDNEIVEARAFIDGGEFPFATSITRDKLIFANESFALGVNRINTISVRYSDYIQELYTNAITVTKGEVDLAPILSTIKDIETLQNEPITIKYTATDDKGISKHEFSSDGINFKTIEPIILSGSFTYSTIFTDLGTHSCKIRVTDTKGQQTTVSFTVAVQAKITAKGEITLLDKVFNKIKTIDDPISCIVIEERNGMFELELEYPATYELANNLVKENIIVADANDTLKQQQFRIYDTKRNIGNRIIVFARHISFDLAYDYIDSIDINNQSCEYALNTIFRSSQFSKDYVGKSDIINAKDFNVSMVNCLEAIGGTKGSILDTYGTGAEILRDNKTISVLNRRGNDNQVIIEYGKNLTGFDLEEDVSNLITKILPYAKYNDENGTEILVKAGFVDSPLILNYSHPYIKHIDYSDKFEDSEIPTPFKLAELANKEFRDNKVDIPKMNYKISFIPLSKCAGYEGIEDRISLCDTVIIKNRVYGIETQAKVIKTVFDVLRARYKSMELGEPKTSLGDIVGGGGSGEDGKPGPPGPIGPPGQDGNLGDFPDSLPATPVLTGKVYGFSLIELSWTFENKVYYGYELYASKTANFTPNTFNRIFEGQASTFLFQALPNEVWYFKACAINSFGKRTAFSNQSKCETTKVADLSNYVASASIGDALIGELNLGRGWVGELRGNYIDAKQLSVTDGNGKRTLDIDSFGNVNLDVTSLKISSKQVATQEYTSNLITNVNNSIANVSDAVGNLNTEMNGAFKDGVITEAEKEGIRSSLKLLTSKKKEIDDEFNVLYNNTDLTGTAKTNLNTYKGYYNTRYTTLINHINKLLGQTTISTADKNTYNTNFTNHDTYLGYYRERATKAVEAISEKKKSDATGYTDAQFKIADGKISQKVSNGDFETYKTQTATQIASKVTSGQVSTIIEQNPNSVKIAWNKYTNYVQFEYGGLAIYNGSVSTNQKRAFFDENGNHFWRDGYYLGKIGTNQWNTDNSKKGIVFDLNEQGAYMTWASKRVSTDTGYTARLLYANKDFDKYTANKLYLGAVLHCQDYGVYDPTVCFTKNWFEYYQAGAGSLNGAVINRFSNNAGKMFFGSGVASSMNSIFELGYNSGLQAYRSLNMNGYSIVNSSSVLADEFLVEEAKDPFVRYIADDYSSETIALNSVETANTVISSATRTLTPNIEICGTGNIVNGSCQIDFTDGIIYDDYIVNLTAIGRNTVYLMEKNTSNFVVEADADCSFDYIVKFITKTKEVLPVSLMNGRENRSHIQSGIPDEAKEIKLGGA